MAVAAAPAPRGNAQEPAASGPVMALPFVQGAHEHTEPFYQNPLITPGANALQFGPQQVPSYGYLRHIVIDVDMSGGNLGAGVLHPDFPFNILQNITLNDTNGAPIFGPYDGYATLWANIIGAYGFRSDPRQYPDYDGTINGRFQLRIPIEISHHDGLGSLANQNSAAAYQVSFSVAPTTTMFTTPPTTPPNLAIQMSLEAWSLPNETDRAGRPQAQLPPAHGTTMYHSQNQKIIALGDNTTQILRVGNLIRWMAFICRTTAANQPRTSAVFPDRATIQWDARELLNDSQVYRRMVAFERIPSLAAMDAGVFIYSFNHCNENKVGDDSPTMWLPTVQATRLEVQGNSASAGTIQILICDIAPGEVVPSERYVETSATGFHPQVGASVPNVQ